MDLPSLSCVCLIINLSRLHVYLPYTISIHIYHRRIHPVISQFRYCLGHHLVFHMDKLLVDAWSMESMARSDMTKECSMEPPEIQISFGLEELLFSIRWAFEKNKHLQMALSDNRIPHDTPKIWALYLLDKLPGPHPHLPAPRSLRPCHKSGPCDEHVSGPRHKSHCSG